MAFYRSPDLVLGGFSGGEAVAVELSEEGIRRVFTALQRRLLRALQLGVVCEFGTEVGLGSRISCCGGLGVVCEVGTEVGLGSRISCCGGLSIIAVIKELCV